MSNAKTLGRGLRGVATALGGLITGAARADTVTLGLNGGPEQRALTSAFPRKGSMILQCTRPPLLENPFEVFDQGVFTPNDRFCVRWRSHRGRGYPGHRHLSGQPKGRALSSNFAT